MRENAIEMPNDQTLHLPNTILREVWITGNDIRGRTTTLTRRTETAEMTTTRGQSFSDEQCITRSKNNTYTFGHAGSRKKIRIEILPVDDPVVISRRDTRSLTTLVVLDRMDKNKFTICNAIVRTYMPPCRKLFMDLPQAFYKCEVQNIQHELENVSLTTLNLLTQTAKMKKIFTRQTEVDKFSIQRECTRMAMYNPPSPKSAQHRQPLFLLALVSIGNNGRVLPESLTIKGRLEEGDINQLTSNHMVFAKPETDKQQLWLSVVRALVTVPKYSRDFNRTATPRALQHLRNRILLTRPLIMRPEEISPLEVYLWLNGISHKYYDIRKSTQWTMQNVISISKRTSETSPWVASDLLAVMSGSVIWTTMLTPPIITSGTVKRYMLSDNKKYISPPILMNVVQGDSEQSL